jgi:hypothetical protein
MQFTSKLTTEDYKEYRSLAGSSTRAAIRLIMSIVVWFILLTKAWHLSAAELADTPSALPYIALAWVGGIGFLAWIYSSRRQVFSRRMEKTNSKRPDRVTLTDAGVYCEGAAGTGVIPWHRFTSWREGKRIFLLTVSAGKSFIILPVSDVPDREAVRQFLRAHIAQPGH